MEEPATPMYMENNVQQRAATEQDLERAQAATNEKIERVRTELHEKIERMCTELLGEIHRLEVKLEATKFDLIKWMFIFWATSFGGIATIFFYMLRFLPGH
ncbi:hypothetical protein HRbin36_02436 [bacterium HR36]|nr:hypothetical protein HRbin36_02436 [bacterium HR36]